MLQLPDLFHESRLAEVTLPLILYTPIGLCLVLLRSIGLLSIFLLSFLLPPDSSLINDAISFILTFLYADETVRNARGDHRNTAKIIVSNRVSIFDTIALRKYFANERCKWVNLWQSESVLSWFKLHVMRSHRTQEELIDQCVNRLEQPNTQLLFLPECDMTTGTDGLLRFSLVPFTLAQKQHVAISPVSLRISCAFQIRPTTFNSHPLADLFWFLFSPFTRFHINCLPSVTPTETSSDELICENVREAISRAMGVESTPFDEREVVELKQRPDRFRQRHEQRRVEFQQMIHLVHQQVPQASLEAIRYDLETTKNVPKTIANLNERVAAAARAANKASASGSSSAMSKSSGSNNHRVTYERLKQELIEKNRQLFLNKNSN